MAGARDRDQGKYLQAQAMLGEAGKGIWEAGKKLALNTEIENLNVVQEKKKNLKLRFNKPIKKLLRPQIIS